MNDGNILECECTNGTYGSHYGFNACARIIFEMSRERETDSYLLNFVPMDFMTSSYVFLFGLIRAKQSKAD